MHAKDTDSRLVYSSEHGRICSGCGRPIQKCCCQKSTSPASTGDGIVRIHRESKGRKGKGVTLISGIPLPPDELKKLARTLKQKCGTGGTVKNGSIEIQGDHREMLLTELQQLGWKVKLAGG